MISLAELSYTTQGLFKLLRFDARGLTQIDTSPAGALRSFWLALYLAPVFFWLDLGFDDQLAYAPLVIAVWGLMYVFAWLIFPGLVLHMDRALVRPYPGDARRAAGIIALSNWMSLISLALGLVLIGLSSTMAPDTLAVLSWLKLAYIFAVLGFGYWHILTRTQVSTALRTTISLVALEFTLMIAVHVSQGIMLSQLARP